MREFRGVRYGRNLPVLVKRTIRSIPKAQREDYQERFLKELTRYSFDSRKKGEPRNEGCIKELETLVDCDITNPEHFAKLIKEGIHLMYPKQTAKKVFDALLRDF